MLFNPGKISSYQTHSRTTTLLLFEGVTLGGHFPPFLRDLFSRFFQDISALSREEREKYDGSIKIYRDMLATVEYAETKGLSEGRAEGLAEGLNKGRAEGLAEGLNKGFTKGQTETARNLKSLGISTEIIMQSTGLSKEEIEQL